jgi:HAD superfamily hydrolase (TIGR01490 family)
VAELHFFDVDHTIVRGSTVLGFILRGLRRGLIGPSLVLYLPYLFVLFNFVGPGKRHLDRAYPFLMGMRREELDALARELFAERIEPRLDRSVMRRIESIRERGGRVAIASSSFGFILAPLAERLGIGEVVASELELRDGTTTGRTAGPPAYGAGKRERVLGYLASVGVAPEDCAFYSDSYRDLSLLRGVGSPVAVNPGRRLRRVAEAEGWEILDTSREAKEAPIAGHRP